MSDGIDIDAVHAKRQRGARKDRVENARDIEQAWGVAAA